MDPTPAGPPAPVVKTAEAVLETVEGYGLRFAIRVGGFPLVLDTGRDARGPSPMDALLAALGACTGMDVVSILRKKREPVTGYAVAVAGERRMSEHPKVYTRIEIVHRVRGRGVSPASVEEAVRLSDTRYCAVHAMLGSSTTITSRFEISEE
jgi:putative redox protein